MKPSVEFSSGNENLARVAAYGLLAEALRYPTPEQWSVLTDRRHWADWPKAVGAMDFETGDALRQVNELLLSPDPANAIDIETLQTEYVRLFGHTVRGSCPAYELEFGAGEIFQRSAELSDIRGFYSAFGLELGGAVRERPDHVTVECEFMSVMAAKEAYAEKEPGSEGRDVLREASARFLDAHLGRWLPSLARRIHAADPESFYGALGRFAGLFIALECHRCGVPCGAALLELRECDEREETTQACAIEDFGGSCPLRSPDSSDVAIGRNGRPGLD